VLLTWTIGLCQISIYKFSNLPKNSEFDSPRKAKKKGWFAVKNVSGPINADAAIIIIPVNCK